MRSRGLLWLAAVLLGAGCDGITTVSELPATATLEVGDELRLPGRNLRLVLEEVAEDSRCPVNALCVWEGRVIVQFEVIRNRPDPGETTLMVSTEAPATFEGVRLQIVGVAPARFSEVEIDPDDYRITIRVEQAPTFNRWSVASGR
ncbi:MAG: hypothetical protein ACT4PM_14610 [Gemmatimonadales bacterium]